MPQEGPRRALGDFPGGLLTPRGPGQKTDPYLTQGFFIGENSPHPHQDSTDIGLDQIFGRGIDFSHIGGSGELRPPDGEKLRPSTQNPVQPDVGGTLVWVGAVADFTRPSLCGITRGQRS